MNTTIFDNAIGTTVPKIINGIPDEWHRVYNDRYIYVYRHNSVPAFAVFACDDDNVIRTCNVKRNRNGKWENIYLYNGIFDRTDSYRDIREYENVMSKIVKVTMQQLPVCTLLDKKNAVRRFYNRMAAKPVYNSVPLLNSEKSWRSVRTDDESITDFIIIPDKGQTTKDIEEFVFSTVGYHSAYDFPTGKMITMSWDYKRIPCGIAIIHNRGIDW